MIEQYIHQKNPDLDSMITVLYVDDEQALLELGKLYLEKSGTMCVDIIDSAPKALETIRSIQYDAIVSDYQMPELDGIAFLKILAPRTPDTPIHYFHGKRP